MTSTLFNIIIISDSVFERTETFHLTIVGGNLPNRVSFGDVRRTTVTIYDFVSQNMTISFLLLQLECILYLCFQHAELFTYENIVYT